MIDKIKILYAYGLKSRQFNEEFFKANQQLEDINNVLKDENK